METVNSELTVDNVERTIDIASQLVKMTTKLTISNGGRGAVKSFHFAVEQLAKANLAFIGATVSTI